MGSTFIETCLIVGIATTGVVCRPWRLPEVVFAVIGAVLLAALGLLPWEFAWRGVAKGCDVYLFLIGMMLLAELARQEGLFDWLAGRAAVWARGSPVRLFNFIYALGTLVTILLSNDATAVVLTPAITAMTRRMNAEKPLPYLFVSAFIANAASFVLPISNPANLVIYGNGMPPLSRWVAQYALPSALAIAATYLALRLTQSRDLRASIAADPPPASLTPGCAAVACGIAATALILLLASAADLPLGAPTCLAGVSTTAFVLWRGRRGPWPLLHGITWSVLPLVAGLFVMVEALERIGLLAELSRILGELTARSVPLATWSVGCVLAVVSNLVNNLPAGLIAGTAVQAAALPPSVAGAALIGIDLGPNLSVTGSLATILWLTALRREGIEIGTWRFLKIGAVVMPPALILALLGVMAVSHAG